MIGRNGVEQRPTGEYAALVAQSVRAIRDRLEPSRELMPGVKYESFRVDTTQFSDQAERGIARFSIWDSLEARMVYNFLPNGTVIKTGEMIKGRKKILYTQTRDILPLTDEFFDEEVLRSPLPVDLEELTNVTRVIQDPRENIGIAALLPRLPISLN